MNRYTPDQPELGIIPATPVESPEDKLRREQDEHNRRTGYSESVYNGIVQERRNRLN